MNWRKVVLKIHEYIPKVKEPEKIPPFKQRVLWTALSLFVFFFLGKITLFGISPTAEVWEQIVVYQLVFASNIGTLLTLGIGPIVLSAILLQLLIGAEMLPLDLSKAEDREVFRALERLLTFLLAGFQGFIYANWLGATNPFVVALQIMAGTIILMYLDEVVQKYGFGSGIGLFIVAGVAETIIWRGFSPMGHLPGLLSALASGKGFLAYLVPYLVTLGIFLFIVYLEGMYINIPIARAGVRAGARFPLKFLYVSNIPVIFAVAIMVNIQFLARLATGTPLAPILGEYKKVGDHWEIVGGLAYFTVPPYGLIPRILSGEIPAQEIGKEILRAVGYTILLVLFSVLLGWLWVVATGQGPEGLAEQIEKIGLQIPGFRRDRRVIRKVLEKYIPPLVIFSSALVGLISAFVDLFGGLASGMGVLLAVSIVNNIYRQLEREKVLGRLPSISAIFG